MGSINYPANFMLIAAMNPCVCGFLTDPQKECTCTPLQIQRYRSKVSGPLLDRIDIQVEVPGLRYQELASKDAGESSDVIRQRVNAARSIQLQRFEKSKIHANAQMGTREIKRYCAVNADAEKLLETAINKLGLSAAPAAGSSKSAAPSPTSPAPKKSSRLTLPSRFNIEAWIEDFRISQQKT
jgi:magnesium chelatase family protein